MKNEWDADLRLLLASQVDLRRRMEALDARIAQLQLRAEASEIPVPVAEVSPSDDWHVEESLVPPPLPPALVEVPREKAPPVPAKVAVSTPEPSAENLELQVGKYWLVRAGILVLLTGLVLLGNLAYHTFITKLGAPGKLALLYLAGGLLVGAGLFLEKRLAHMRNYARVLLAGGAATIYYTTYAAHFVAPLRVIENPILGGVLLLILAGGLAWLAERRRSQGVAFTAILLSYYTSVINPAANFTLFSNVLLTAAAVLLLVRHRWFGISWLSLAGSYASFAYWRWHSAGDLAAGLPQLWLTHGFLLAYWIIFTLAVFFQRAETFRSIHRVLFLTANNAAFFVLAAPAFAGWYPREFWVFGVIFGAVLLGLAGLACRMKRDEPSFDGAYLAQGLIVLAIGIAAKFTGYQLAVILILQSTVFMFCSRFRHRLLYQIASLLAAGWALVLALETLSRPLPYAWVVGVVVASFLIVNAWLMKSIRGTLPELRWEWIPAVFATAGVMLTGVVLANRFDDDALLWAWAMAAIGLTVLLRFHRLPELAVGAQGFLAASWIFLFSLSLRDGVTWSSGLPVLGAALLVMHWWQRQNIFSGLSGRAIEGLDAVAFCTALLMWLAPGWKHDGEMAVLVFTGLCVLAYGIFTKAWFLAILSQIFTACGVWLCFRFMLEESPAWHLTLATIALTAVQASAWRWIPEPGKSSLKFVFLAYRTVILLLGIFWMLETVAMPLRFLVMTLTGGVIFLPAAVKKSREYLAYSAAFLGLALVFFWSGMLQGAPVSGYDFVGLLLLLALQQAGRSLLGATNLFPAEVQASLSIIAVLGLWLQSSRWAWEGESGLAVTIVWGLLAFALLGAGFLRRERVWRLMGLLILAVAVGHVFFVDVWKMGQFAGILGIIGLALVLLLLGFIYNRFAAQIKKWI